MIDRLSRPQQKGCKLVKLSRGVFRLRHYFGRQQKWRSKQLLHSTRNPLKGGEELSLRRAWTPWGKAGKGKGKWQKVG